MREFRRGKNEANLHGLAFHEKSLVWGWRHDISSKKANLSATKPRTQCKKPFSFHNPAVNAGQCESTSSSQFLRRDPWGTPAKILHTPPQSSPSSFIALLTTSPGAPSAMDNIAYCRVCSPKKHETLQCTFIPVGTHQVFTPFYNYIFKRLPAHTRSISNWPDRGKSQNRNCFYAKVPPRELKRQRLPQEFFSAPAVSVLEPERLNKRALLDFADTRGPYPLSLTSRFALSTIPQSCASKQKKTILEKNGRFISLSRIPFTEICPRKHK